MKKDTPQESQAVETTTKKTAEVSFLRTELNKVAQLKKEFAPEQLAFVKGLVNTDLRDSELLIFLQFSSKLQLNPMLGEIIAVVYNKNEPDKRRVNYIVPRNGKRIVANRTGGLEKVVSNPIYVKEIDGRMQKVEAWEGGALWGATATVTRDGVDYTVTVPLKEYNTSRDVWNSKPETMIKKVAESQALSAAYPELLGGVYDDAEAPSMEWKSLPEISEAKAGEPASPEQKATLKSMKIEFSEDVTYADAIRLISEATQKKVKK